MTTKEYLEKYTKVTHETEPTLNMTCHNVIDKASGCWLTAYYDDQTIENVYNDKFIRILANHDMTDIGSTCKSAQKHRVANYGYSNKDNKWYGWSHRGIYGFKVGSEVKKGDVAYMSKTSEDYKSEVLNSLLLTNPIVCYIKNEDDDGFEVATSYNADKKEFVERYYYPKIYGHGEWKAKTMEDAKTMAMNYADNIG